MAAYQFERESRTSESEAYAIYSEGSMIGRVDVHYGAELVNATLCVPDSFSEDNIHELISEVDERIVMTADPFREDLIATVWLGRLAGVYSEDIEEDLEEGNGHH
jgi:hypothetical protein